MLGKLLKYDLKYMLKNMSAFYVLAIFFSITTRILFSLEQTIIINILGQVSVGCMVAILVNILINTVIRSWVRFRESIYLDESYLTHTLPVTKNQIYNSKFLQVLIFYLVGFLVIITSLFIAYYNDANWEMLKGLINSITTGLNFSTTFFVGGMLLVIFLEIFNAIQCGFLGMILGYKQNNSKVLLSICFGFIAYLIAQFIVLAMVFIVALFDEGLMNMFTSNVLNNVGSLKILINLTIILYVVIIFVMSIVCKKILNKGVDVE